MTKAKCNSDLESLKHKYTVIILNGIGLKAKTQRLADLIKIKMKLYAV